jgi:hypothetical protein
MPEGPAFGSSPELSELASWLARTGVSVDDFAAYLERVPLGRVYEVADECRRRAAVWAELAACLEKEARNGRRSAAS